MSSFTEPLIVEVLPTTRRGQGEFLVYKEFHYDVGFLGSGDTITVPVGYNTDLCSVPWFARAFIPISGKAAKPALLHDWLLVQEDPRAHTVFDEALRVMEVKPFMRWILVTSVRLWAAIKKIF